MRGSSAGDADLVHRRHHLVTRNVLGPVQHTVPSLRSVCLISVDLGIDGCHWRSSGGQRPLRN
jgi:transposase